MERKKIKVVVVAVLVSTLVGGFVNTSSAASNITTAQAQANYATALATAKASFLVAVKPSRARMVEEGKKAEAIRRSSVKSALVAFNAVIAIGKSTSLIAEKSYRAAVVKSAASPTSLSLKADVKANLAALTKAATALGTDAKVSAAKVAFASARTNAMNKFKAALDISIKERAITLERASMRFKADKARALMTLQASLKKASK